MTPANGAAATTSPAFYPTVFPGPGYGSGPGSLLPSYDWTRDWRTPAQTPVVKAPLPTIPQPAFWILWNETYPAAPKVKFTTRNAAVLRAQEMADEYGETFHVMAQTATLVPDVASRKCPRGASCFICWPAPTPPFGVPILNLNAAPKKETTTVSSIASIKTSVSEIEDSISATDENVFDLTETVDGLEITIADLQEQIDELIDARQSGGSDSLMEDAVEQATTANDIRAAIAVLDQGTFGAFTGPEHKFLRATAARLIEERVLGADF